MIRSKDLTDKLIADLHFHNYLNVNVGDDFFTNVNRGIDQTKYILADIGLADKIDAETDFFHGGNVLTAENTDYINTYLDDVFIDYFFRTFKFKEIVFPKGLCYEQITPDGIIHPQEDITLNLNNLYDRCTFANNIYRLFGIDTYLAKRYPGNRYIKSFSLNFRVYGLHSWCGALINNKSIYSYPLDQFIDKYYPRYALQRSNRRGRTLKEFVGFVYNYNECNHDYFNNFSNLYLCSLNEFEDGFAQIRDEKIFGEYTIEDILLIYALLIDKFLLHEDSFLLTLCLCIKTKIMENGFLNDFILFEENNLNSKSIEPFIKSKDLYLRFASHSKSKAFTFEPINDVLYQIKLFGKQSTQLVGHSNTMPLPYLNNLTTESR